MTDRDYAPPEPVRRSGLLAPVGNLIGACLFLCALPALVFFILAMPGH